MLAVSEETMPKARPVSLHPLTFDEAIKAIINVDLEKVGIAKNTRSKRPDHDQPKHKQKHS